MVTILFEYNLYISGASSPGLTWNTDRKTSLTFFYNKLLKKLLLVLLINAVTLR